MPISRQLERNTVARPEATAQAVAVTCSRGIHSDGDLRSGDPFGLAIPAATNQMRDATQAGATTAENIIYGQYLYHYT